MCDLAVGGDVAAPRQGVGGWRGKIDVGSGGCEGVEKGIYGFREHSARHV